MFVKVAAFICLTVPITAVAGAFSWLIITIVVSWRARGQPGTKSSIVLIPGPLDSEVSGAKVPAVEVAVWQVGLMAIANYCLAYLARVQDYYLTDEASDLASFIVSFSSPNDVLGRIQQLGFQVSQHIDQFLYVAAGVFVLLIMIGFVFASKTVSSVVLDRFANRSGVGFSWNRVTPVSKWYPTLILLAIYLVLAVIIPRIAGIFLVLTVAKLLWKHVANRPSRKDPSGMCRPA